jgi:type I restriction enzyme S subunit
MELTVNERIGNNVEVMQKVRLKHIVKISKGKKSIEVNSSNLRYIQIGDLRNDNNLKYAEHSKSNVLCTKNDVLIAWDGANAGTIGYNLEGAVGSTLAKLVINDNYKIFPNFLGRFLQTKSKSLRDNCSGATIPHISKSELENIEIPLPSLLTQQKIAEILDTADQLRQYNKQLIEKYDALTQSLFLDMFGDPVRNEKGWDVKCLGDIIDFLTSGSRGWAKYYSDEGDVFLRIQNVGYNKLKLDDLTYIQTPETAEAKRTKVQTGDIIISITADLGRTGVIPTNFPKAFINQHLAILRLKENYNPNYVSAFIASIGGQALFQKLDKGGVKSGLNFTDLKSYLIFCPPLSLQNQFAERVQMIETQKQQAQEALAKSEDLFQSLLQRAFKGELI